MCKNAVLLIIKEQVELFRDCFITEAELWRRIDHITKPSWDALKEESQSGVLV